MTDIPCMCAAGKPCGKVLRVSEIGSMVHLDIIGHDDTKESIAKKYAQFEISSPGNKLIVISLVDNNFHDPLSGLWKYLEDMMP